MCLTVFRMNGHASSDMGFSPGTNDSLLFDETSHSSQFCTKDNVGECLSFLYQVGLLLKIWKLKYCSLC